MNIIKNNTNMTLLKKIKKSRNKSIITLNIKTKDKMLLIIDEE